MGLRREQHGQCLETAAMKSMEDTNKTNDNYSRDHDISTNPSHGAQIWPPDRSRDRIDRFPENALTLTPKSRTFSRLYLPTPPKEKLQAGGWVLVYLSARRFKAGISLMQAAHSAGRRVE